MMEEKKIISTFNHEKPQVVAGELKHTSKQGLSFFSKLEENQREMNRLRENIYFKTKTMNQENNLLEWMKTCWSDTPEFHKMVHEKCIQCVNEDPTLKAYRDYIEAGAWGMGERSFVWMWALIMQEISKGGIPYCLEIGVHRGAILALWHILNPKLNRVCGVSPMNGRGIGLDNGHDFTRDVELLWQHFKIEAFPPIIFKTVSSDPKTLKLVQTLPPTSRKGWDLIYIDGSHAYEDVKFDLLNYAPLVRPGGILVIDDACNDMHMPWGFFQGIDDVTRATKEVMDNNEGFEFLFNVVHNRVYTRVK